ncbi:MAG: hypothetical protein HXX18_02170 [Bacteroidetes bacterium]|nr:hypothetical protein [Bacteroidota bacterium]
MKKIAFCLITATMLLCVQPLMAKDTTTVVSSVIVDSKLKDATEAKTLLLRLNEIKEMDKSKLNASEKKSLRKEVRAIKTELQATEARGGGVYLSVGAIIIIILLLIILL